MRRGGLFLIGVASAIATLISLNLALGRSWNDHDRYCYHHYRNDRYHDQRDHENRDVRRGDSAKINQ